MITRESLFGLVLISVSLLGGCGGSGSSLMPPSNRNVSESDNITDVRAWKPSAPYGDVIYDCALKIYENEACSLETLPLLGMETTTPTTEDILGRLLVSHDWMGERFAALLAEYPATMLQLFSGLTAIVIDDDIRPAFYTSHTGAIYLDPDYLWTTVSEKKTINPKEDFRSNYSDPLAFRAWGRYLKNGSSAFSYGSLDDNNPRSFNDVVLINARLLLHELAHVNDALPPDSYPSLNRSLTVDQAATTLTSGLLSDQLSDLYPLNSSVLSGLGQVMYQGATATNEQRSISAAEAGAEFESDSAADTYAYSSQFEDLAMLFEIAMMKHYWGLDYEMTFVTPTGTQQYCNEYLIGWAALNWIGASHVKTRAMFVTNTIIPTEDMTSFYANLPDTSIYSGGDWCLSTAPTDGQAKPQNRLTTPVNPAEFELHPL